MRPWKSLRGVSTPVRAKEQRVSKEDSSDSESRRRSSHRRTSQELAENPKRNGPTWILAQTLLKSTMRPGELTTPKLLAFPSQTPMREECGKMEESKNLINITQRLEEYQKTV